MGCFLCDNASEHKFSNTSFLSQTSFHRSGYNCIHDNSDVGSIISYPTIYLGDSRGKMKKSMHLSHLSYSRSVTYVDHGKPNRARKIIQPRSTKPSTTTKKGNSSYFPSEVVKRYSRKSWALQVNPEDDAKRQMKEIIEPLALKRVRQIIDQTVEDRFATVASPKTLSQSRMSTYCNHKHDSIVSSEDSNFVAKQSNLSGAENIDRDHAWSEATAKSASWKHPWYDSVNDDFTNFSDISNFDESSQESHTLTRVPNNLGIESGTKNPTIKSIELAQVPSKSPELKSRKTAILSLDSKGSCILNSNRMEEDSLMVNHMKSDTNERKFIEPTSTKSTRLNMSSVESTVNARTKIKSGECSTWLLIGVSDIQCHPDGLTKTEEGSNVVIECSEPHMNAQRS